MDRPIVVQELFNLNAVEGGLRPGAISFKTVSLESDKFVCVRDLQPDGQTSLVLVDLEKKISERHNIKDAEAATVNPAQKIIALRSGNNLQIFDLVNRSRVKSYSSPEAVVFWKWVSPQILALVTNSAVLHWSLDAASEPVKMFDRSPEMDPSVQILNYKTDKDQKWLMLMGVARNPADGQLAGKTQLHSMEKGASRVLEGHAGTFITTTVSAADPRPCNIMCLAWNSPTGGRLMIMELPTGAKTDLSLERRVVNLNFPTAQDFPVYLHVSPNHKLLFVISSRGLAIIVDVVTSQVIFADQVTQSVVFGGTAMTRTGGALCVGNQGSVFHVSINDAAIAKYLHSQLQNPEMALRIASNAKLGGVDELFKAHFVNLLAQGNIEGAVKACMEAPNNVLRTAETLERLSSAPVMPGGSPALSTYFKMMLAAGKLNAVESVELAKVVLAKGGVAYVKQQFEEDKLEVSEQLGELIASADSETAMKMFYKCGAHHKVVNIFLTRGEAQKAVAYCKKVEYNPDWRLVLLNFIRVNPADAVGLALMLHRDMGSQPIIAPNEVVDMFLPGQNIKQLTEFLLEVLQHNDTQENGPLQTRLLEINLKHSPPQVAERIFAQNFCSFYDPVALAPLCERAGLYQRALECYLRMQKVVETSQLPSMKRCLQHASTMSPEWLVEFFGRIAKPECLECLKELIANLRANFKVIIQVATKYSDALGPENLIHMLLEAKSFEALYYYLGSIVPYTRNPEVHFRYIEAATEVGQISEVERMTRESPCYEPERTKNYLKDKKLADLWPLINVCDQHNFMSELVKYLLDTHNNTYIEQYVQRRNPKNTPAVIGALMDCDVSEAFVKSVLHAAGPLCPIGPLVEEVERRGRLRMLQDWLESRRGEKSVDPLLHNALGKILVDTGANPQEFLENNEYYDPVVLGKYCENRDPTLALIAYRKGHLNSEIVDLCTKNGMWKQLARYLVQQQNLELWSSVLQKNTPERKFLVEAVQQVALPETKVAEEVSVTVRAFMDAEMTHELTSLLEKIVLHGSFRQNRFLQNLLIMSAIKSRQDKVLEYVNVLDDYDAQDIATIATGADLHEVAFTVYQKHKLNKGAINVLINDMKALPRARSFAATVDEPTVWTLLAQALLAADEVCEGIDALIRAKNPDFVGEVVEAAERTNQFGDLIKYLTMARQESKTKDPKIDTCLVRTYAKTGRLADLEEFLKQSHGLQVLNVADLCFADGLYDAARILYTSASNFPKLASTFVKLGNLQAAVEAATKAQSTKTWKEVLLACLAAGDTKLAHVCAINVVIHAEELLEVVRIYESLILTEELMSVLKASLGHQGAHMGLFTELGVLYAKYKPEKLLDHIKTNPKKINTHRLINACEQYHHWLALRVLHVNNEDWLAATNSMIEHFVDSWDHEIFKDVVTKLGASDVLYQAIVFYINTHPELLHDLLTTVIKKVDPERVLSEVSRHVPVAFIRQYLEAVQERNLKRINETLNNLYIEEEDFAALRRSVDTFNNFDSAEISQRLEKMELFEFRKIALMLHRRTKRFHYAIEVAKDNKLYQEAINAAAESKDADLVEKLLRWFVEQKLQECFAACLYTCYEFIQPHVVLELAWMNDMKDAAMPFLIQTLQEFGERIGNIERTMNDAQKAARETAANAGILPTANAPLMIQYGAPAAQPPFGNPGGFTSF